MWWSKTKGFGLMSQHTGGDVVVHHSSLTIPGFKERFEGDRVSFKVGEEIKGPGKESQKTFSQTYACSLYTKSSLIFKIDTPTVYVTLGRREEHGESSKIHEKAGCHSYHFGLCLHHKRGSGPRGNGTYG